MKDYYLLVGLNSKEIKILSVYINVIIKTDKNVKVKS